MVRVRLFGMATALGMVFAMAVPVPTVAQQADDVEWVDENGNVVDPSTVDADGFVIEDGGFVDGGDGTPPPATPAQPTAPTIVQQVPAPTPPAQNAGATGVDANGILAAHNRLRARHGVPPLAWSAALQQSSQQWSDQCNFNHSATGNGENLSAWSGGGATQANRVDDWYSEIQFYDYANRTVPYVDPPNATGHFTQVVWRATTQVGCGVSQCPGIGMYLTCQYSPAGNFGSAHAANVPPPN